MKIFAVSDLHLSLSAPYHPDQPVQSYKPMTIFGSGWDDFYHRLACSWRQMIGEQDIVLLPGDISWAMQLAEAQHDLEYIAALPGQKVMIRGNHDYWWASISRIRALLPANFHALQNDTVSLGGYAICGTRGWLLPVHNDFKESEDRRIFDRELLRLNMTLSAAAAHNQPIIVMFHYPPLDIDAIADSFMEIISRYPVKYCLYGHIHGNKNPAFEGDFNGVHLINCSVDRLGFAPLLITEV